MYSNRRIRNEEREKERETGEHGINSSLCRVVKCTVQRTMYVQYIDLFEEHSILMLCLILFARIY